MPRLLSLTGTLLGLGILVGCASSGVSPQAATGATVASPEVGTPGTRYPSAVVPPSAASPIPTSPAPELPPLTREAIASCPVTLPNGKSPPLATDAHALEYDRQMAQGFNLGNENGTLFTIPFPGGKVVFTPNGPGAKNPDGSLGMKWPWYRTVEGNVLITGRRLDAPAPRMRPLTLLGAEDGYEETGFEPGGLLFPSEGCWEVTAEVGQDKLTFVTLVARLAFDTPQFLWWPADDLMAAVRANGATDTDLSGYPDTIREILPLSPDRELTIETVRGLVQNRASLARTAILRAIVRGDPAICVRGNMDAQGRWNPEADAGYLEWSSKGMTYRIVHTGLGLSCLELLRMAGSYFLGRCSTC